MGDLKAETVAADAEMTTVVSAPRRLVEIPPVEAMVSLQEGNRLEAIRVIYLTEAMEAIQVSIVPEARVASLASLRGITLRGVPT